uniref:Uncharacterized protein n=1 Tax=Trypanosoma congolense (strain IL3000) TaxID=1068625 RepID=G0UZ49_TRYCI|nr:hypothetical protein, unlikely [Trypanosoma congolense IL3000]
MNLGKTQVEWKKRHTGSTVHLCASLTRVAAVEKHLHQLFFLLFCFTCDFSPFIYNCLTSFPSFRFFLFLLFLLSIFFCSSYSCVLNISFFLFQPDSMGPSHIACLKCCCLLLDRYFVQCNITWSFGSKACTVFFQILMFPVPCAH